MVISGKRGAADTEALVEAAFRPFAPGQPAHCEQIVQLPALPLRAVHRLGCAEQSAAAGGACQGCHATRLAVDPATLVCTTFLHIHGMLRSSPASPADKVVIQLDASDTALMDVWRTTNPAAVAVAEGRPRDGAAAFVCQVGGVAVQSSPLHLYAQVQEPSVLLVTAADVSIASNAPVSPRRRTSLARRRLLSQQRWRSCLLSLVAVAPSLCPRPSQATSRPAERLAACGSP